jgi:hypothetical protein
MAAIRHRRDMAVLRRRDYAVEASISHFQDQWCEKDRTGRGVDSAFAQKLVDAALQLPLFLLALAQPLLEIGDRQFR